MDESKSMLKKPSCDPYVPAYVVHETQSTISGGPSARFACATACGKETEQRKEGIEKSK